MDVVKEMKLDDLKTIGSDSLWHRTKIMKEIAKLNTRENQSQYVTVSVHV